MRVNFRRDKGLRAMISCGFELHRYAQSWKLEQMLFRHDRQLCVLCSEPASQQDTRFVPAAC